MHSTSLFCKCGQEDWLSESRGLTAAGLDKYGRTHRIFAECDPKPRYRLRTRVITDNRSDPPYVITQWKVEGLNWATWWFPTSRMAIEAVLPKYPGVEFEKILSGSPPGGWP